MAIVVFRINPTEGQSEMTLEGLIALAGGSREFIPILYNYFPSTGFNEAFRS